MRFYGQITKVEPQEDGAIKVIGVASTGALDDVGERILPDAMKAALPAYMRFGALREMHGLSAAGSTLKAEVDADGATRIEALVVDPVAVRKVQMGVYRGFSVGGKVLARDPGDRKIITKLKLNEISLVDRPCNPEAVIDMWKADASAPPAPSNAEVVARAVAMAAAAGRPGRHTDFVLKARESLVAEAVADAEADEAEEFFDEALAGTVGGEPAAKVGARNSAEDMARIQAAHDHLADLGARCRNADDDDDDENEEPQGKASAWVADDLAKALAENARLTHQIEVMAPQVEHLSRTVEAMERQLERLAEQPVPPRAMAGTLRAVAKAEDGGPDGSAGLSAEVLKSYFDSLPEAERGQIQLRAALRQPFAVGR